LVYVLEIITIGRENLLMRKQRFIWAKQKNKNKNQGYVPKDTFHHLYDVKLLFLWNMDKF